MVEYQPGVENIITREKLMIKVIIYSLKEDDKVVVEKTLNYSDFDDRKELGKLSFWAYKHNCSIETLSMADAEAEIMENGNG